MTALRRIVLLGAMLLISMACSLFVPPATQTPAATARVSTATQAEETLTAPAQVSPEAAATETQSPEDSATPEEAATPQAEPTETLDEIPQGGFMDLPTGEPASDWEGIPVMPGALAGDGDQEGYSYTIQAGADEVQAYYEKELAKDGWEPFATGDSESDNRLLFFMKDSDLLSIVIMDAGKNDGTLLVMLVK